MTKYLFAMTCFVLTLLGCGEEPDDLVICEFVVVKIVEDQEQIKCKPVEEILIKGKGNDVEESGS